MNAPVASNLRADSELVESVDSEWLLISDRWSQPQRARSADDAVEEYHEQVDRYPDLRIVRQDTVRYAPFTPERREPKPLAQGPEADAWDAGEQHPSARTAAGAARCYPHTSCSPYTDPDLSAAFNAGCREEEHYVGIFGQFNPNGHLMNPFRYPPRPLVSKKDAETILTMHRAGVGTRPIAGQLGIKRPLVMGIIRKAKAEADAAAAETESSEDRT